MEFNAYQEASKRTATLYDVKEVSLVNGGFGLCGEAGEVVDQIKKVLFQHHPLDKDKIAEELGDVLWYVSYIAWAVGLTLDEVATANIEKLRKRYPEGFDKERSLHREGA